MNGKAPVSRVKRTKAEAQASYDLISGWYDWLAGSAEKQYKETGLRQLALSAGERVLEIGSGTGQCLPALVKSTGSSGRVIGIDLSPGMCRVARAKLQQAGMVPRVPLTIGDAAILPFPASFFDAVFMSFTLELFDTPEIPIVLAGCRRVLRPGGRLCVVSMAKKERDSLMVALYEWSHDKFTKYVDCRPIYVQDEMEEAGFETLSKIEMSMFGLPVDIVLARVGGPPADVPPFD